MVAGVERQLEVLARAGLIQSSTVGDAGEYVFKHGLTQESVYRGLLRRERMRLHQAIGELLERQPEDRGERLELLAHHFFMADDPRAFRYLCGAADSALAKYALVEAERLYTDALELGLRESASVEDVSHILTRRGRGKELAADYDGALADYDELERLARERDEPQFLLAGATAKARLLSVGTPAHDPQAAMEYAGLGLRLARSLDDAEAQARLGWIQAITDLFSGNPARAINHAEKALEVARQKGLQDLEVHILMDLGNARWFVGQAREALSIHEEATPLWRSAGNIPMLIDNLSQQAVFCYSLGEFGRALELSEEAIRLADEIRHPWAQAQSRIALAYTLWEQGKIDAGRAEFESSMQLAEEAGLLFGQVFTTCEFGWRLARLGQLDDGLGMVEFAERTAASKLPNLIEWPLSIKARIWLLQGKVNQAEQVLKDQLPADFADASSRLTLVGATHVGMLRPELALMRRQAPTAQERLIPLVKALRKSNLRPYLAPALILHGRILIELDHLAAAMTEIEEALAIGEGIDAPLIVAEASILLAELERRLGAPSPGPAHRVRARRSVETILANVGDEALRQAFLRTSIGKSARPA